MSRSFAWVSMLCVAVGLVAAGCKTTPAKEPVPVAKPGNVKLGAPDNAWLLLPMPRQMDVTASMKGSDVIDRGFAPVRPEIDATRMPHPQGYDLTIAPGNGGAPTVTVVAHDDAGAFYAEQTLKQLAQQARLKGYAPACHIVDWPDFPDRGVMLDVARCKVPEMKTLYELVDLFASWKYNQLQLYTEHTFAYRNHSAVWEDASPMTPGQIRDLDAYCRARHIELVPNQNSFGHMRRWLSLPAYAGLAETPDGPDLCPTDPKSIDLLRDMYASLLPNFSSAMANVGCDETYSLGKGRSKAAVDGKGVGRVYLDFLMQLHGIVGAQGKRMQFWADIINNHPELIPELPKDVIAMEWGYDKGHPYPDHTKRFHDNGITFYVVPGTSSWNSFLGRTDNALANLREAALSGRDNGGRGYLVTDWGDGGHWQFLPVSYLPFAYGAAVSWCYDANRDADPTKLADAYAFHDAAGIMGRLAFELGNAHLHSGIAPGNSSVYYAFMRKSLDKSLADAKLDKLKPEDLDGTVRILDELIARIDGAKMDRPDANLIKAEYRMDVALARFGCHLGAARLRAGSGTVAGMPKDVRAKLAAELEALLPEYRQVWLARNRSGGLKESAGNLEAILVALRK